MYNYAQIQDNIVIAISQLSGKVNRDDMISINELTDVTLGSIYNPDTKVFTPVAPLPIDPQPTVEEMQAQTLLNTEYLVSKSELLGGM